MSVDYCLTLAADYERRGKWLAALHYLNMALEAEEGK